MNNYRLKLLRTVTIILIIFFLLLFSCVRISEIISYYNLIIIPSVLEDLISCLYVVSILIAISSFLIWIYLASVAKWILYKQYPYTYKENALSAFWAVAWFFIPIFNLWKGYVSVNEIWQVAHLVKYNDGRCSQTLILVWWFLLIFAPVFYFGDHPIFFWMTYIYNILRIYAFSALTIILLQKVTKLMLISSARLVKK
jgi:hypothetical protein